MRRVPTGKSPGLVAVDRAKSIKTKNGTDEVLAPFIRESLVEMVFFTASTPHTSGQPTTFSWLGVVFLVRNFMLDREEASCGAFDYTEMFYNLKRCHGYANNVSPVGVENQHFNRLLSV